MDCLRWEVATIKVALVDIGIVEDTPWPVSKPMAAFFEYTIAAKVVSVFPNPITSAIIPPRHEDERLTKTLDAGT